MTTAPTTQRPRRSPALALWSIAVGIVVVIAATGVGYGFLYRAMYSPAAFVSEYLTLLAEGRTADAMLIPGVAVDATDLAEAGLDPTVSEALLRTSALTTLADITVTEGPTEDGVTEVTARYRAGGEPGRTTFTVTSDGWSGLAPNWRFAQTPLAAIELRVVGSMQFRVNSFDLDKRQVSAEGIDADPDAPVPLLVFTPGLYAVSVDTEVAAASGIAVLADAPLTQVPITVEAEPKPTFVDLVQAQVDVFLNACAEQKVLQPTACPFGLRVQNRIVGDPAWSLVEIPQVTLQPLGAHWAIPTVQGVARIEVRMQSLFDGSEYVVEEEIPFAMNGIVTRHDDASLTLVINSPDTE